MSPIYSILAKNIKSLRTAASLTQGNLAEKTGVSQTHVAELESGRKSASLDVLIKIAQVLGVNVWELFFDGEQLQDPEAIARLLGEPLANHIRKGLGPLVYSYFQEGKPNSH